MKHGYLLIDGNNIAFAANATRKLHAGDMETQGVYGFLRAIRAAVAAYPMLIPVVLWDGRSWRYDAFSGYKAKREKEPENKSEQAMADNRASMREQKPFIRRALLNLGVAQMVALNLEADDLAGILVRRYQLKGKKILLLSGDKDWIQLIGPGVGWMDPINDVRITAASLKDKLGVETPRQWLEVKALMGDSSDEIPGVGGIGEKGAKELITTYGSVTSFINQINEGSIKPADLHKKFRELAEDFEKQQIFHRNLKLMDLASPEIPAPLGLKVEKGGLSLDDFAALCEELLFNSIISDLQNWCEPFEKAA
jgi:5'-3' exonuclease